MAAAAAVVARAPLQRILVCSTITGLESALCNALLARRAAVPESPLQKVRCECPPTWSPCSLCACLAATLCATAIRLRQNSFSGRPPSLRQEVRAPRAILMQLAGCSTCPELLDIAFDMQVRHMPTCRQRS